MVLRAINRSLGAFELLKTVLNYWKSPVIDYPDMKGTENLPKIPFNELISELSKDFKISGTLLYLINVGRNFETTFSKLENHR